MSRLNELLQVLTNAADLRPVDPRVAQACALCGANPSEASAARERELKTQNILSRTQEFTDMYAKESASLARKLAKAQDSIECKDRELAEARTAIEERDRELAHWRERRAEIEQVMAQLEHARDSFRVSSQ
jgi:uncharacterized protein YhaN